MSFSLSWAVNWLLASIVAPCSTASCTHQQSWSSKSVASTAWPFRLSIRNHCFNACLNALKRSERPASLALHPRAVFTLCALMMCCPRRFRLPLEPAPTPMPSAFSSQTPPFCHEFVSGSSVSSGGASSRIPSSNSLHLNTATCCPPITCTCSGPHVG